MYVRIAVSTPIAIDIATITPSLHSLAVMSVIAVGKLVVFSEAGAE
jgi:hypothetical protein